MTTSTKPTRQMMTSRRWATALSVLSLAALSCGKKPPVEEPPGPPAWTLVHVDLDAALLSVWSDADNVIAVGGDPGDGPLVLRLHDGAWEQLETGAQGALWWVTEAPDGKIWMVGEDGLILRHDLDSGAFDQVDSGTDATLFGAFFDDDGAGTIVGARIQPANEEDPRGVLLDVVDGTATASDAMAATLADHAIFKVWGSGAGDLWVVGERGLVLRRTGAEWREVNSGVTQRLFTVHGAAGHPVRTVGGTNNAVLLGWDGDDATDDSALLGDFAPALNGVHVTGDGIVRVVGAQGFYAEIDGEEVYSPEEPLTFQHLHAVNVDPTGGAWMVGGALLSPAFDAGVMVYYGTRAPPKGMP